MADAGARGSVTKGATPNFKKVKSPVRVDKEGKGGVSGSR